MTVTDALLRFGQVPPDLDHVSDDVLRQRAKSASSYLKANCCDARAVPQNSNFELVSRVNARATGRNEVVSQHLRSGNLIEKRGPRAGGRPSSRAAAIANRKTIKGPVADH